MKNIYLAPTAIIDSAHERIISHAARVVDKIDDPVAMAVKLYDWVRDGIWYDPYTPFYRAAHYRASAVLESGRGYCVTKAGLLCALGRACGIPSRVGFATVRNHLATRQLVAYMGCDLFVYHGYTEFHLEGKWVQATPAFNAALCRRHKVMPLAFNGRENSIFHPYNTEKKKFMEYVAYHGSFADIPVDRIVTAWRQAYGKDRVQQWIDAFEKAGGKSFRDFYNEETISS